jgi:uncharacterized protein (DUF885 family)
MHAKHLWAASRLAVKPGLHLRGWSRAQAIAFMGADRLLAIRVRAQCALRNRFDLPGFHSIVLTGGARLLNVVGMDVMAWVRAADASAGERWSACG